jgi:hypothetical protein
VGTAMVTAAIGIGAAVLAIWIDFRFPRLAPQSILYSVFHLIAASVVARAVVPAGMDLISARPLFAVLGVALPSLIYIFLSWLWFLRLAQRMMFGGGFGAQS